MLDATRNDVEVTGTKADVSIPQVDGHSATENQGKVIRIGMRMPDERPVSLHDHYRMAIELRDRPWRIDLRELLELPFKIDAGVHFGPGFPRLERRLGSSNVLGTTSAAPHNGSPISGEPR
jgi:hypothetical protein